MEQTIITSADEKRRRKYFTHKASEELTVLMRRMDMTSMLMNNLIPYPLVAAAQKFEQFQAQARQDAKIAATGDAAFIQNKIDQGLKDLDPKLVKDWTEFLKYYARAVVVQPKLVDHYTTEPNELWVDDLEGDELLSILNAEHPDEIAARGEKEAASVVTKEQAEEFRGPAQPNDVRVVHGSEDVRIKTERLAVPDADHISA